MGRSIPVALQDELDASTAATCVLLRVEPLDPGYAPYGVTSLDLPVRYDDGRGELPYSSAVGAQPTLVQGSSSLQIDNAEATSLLPEFDIPVSEADIRAGVYDFARFDLYLASYAVVNGEAVITSGHVTIHSGDIGQITITDDGLSYVNELRGLSTKLVQSICQKDSLTCRATFGSQAEASSAGSVVERFPCGVDATALLVPGTVSAVGEENTLTFTVTPFTMGDDELNPGLVFWITGLNAGRSNEVDTNTAAGVITLAHETDWPIQVGDMLDYRVDCNKHARDTVKGCKSAIRWGSEWVLHFRGEPDIPIGDAGAMEMPGASSAPGSGGSTFQPFPTVPE